MLSGIPTMGFVLVMLNIISGIRLSRQDSLFRSI